MHKSISMLILSALIALIGGCTTRAESILYSVIIDRVENDTVVVVVNLSLKGGLSWYGIDARQAALDVAARVVRSELERKGIVGFKTVGASYLEIRQNIHRVGFSISDGSGAVHKLVGQTMLGTTGPSTK